MAKIVNFLGFCTSTNYLILLYYSSVHINCDNYRSKKVGSIILNINPRVLLFQSLG